MRRILLVGGAPRVPVDAVRWLTPQATGATAIELAAQLRGQSAAFDLLLALDVTVSEKAERYRDRQGLEQALGAWIARNPEGVVVMSAAVNDYKLGSVESSKDGRRRAYRLDEKVPSGCDEVLIRLVPDTKLIDQLRPRFGLRGPIVAFKYEDRASVVESARKLADRVGAAIVVANSLCGQVQAAIEGGRCVEFPQRTALLHHLSQRLVVLAK